MAFTMIELLIGIIFIIVVGYELGSFFANFGMKKAAENLTLLLLPGEKLTSAQWHGEKLWITTRQARSEEKPDVWQVREYSKEGFGGGTVIVKETPLHGVRDLKTS